MKSLGAIFIACLVVVHAHAADRPSCIAAARRDFLLGMTAGSGAIVGGGGLEGFWPTEAVVAKLYESVAKRYAAEIGVEPAKIATGEWKVAVAESLRVSREEDPMAFLAGAFARWGTSTGFSLSGSEKAYAIAKRISDLNRFDVQLVHKAGYPGRTTIIVSDGGESQSAELFKRLREFAAEVAKRPNQSPEPTVMSVTPPAAQEPRQP